MKLEDIKFKAKRLDNRELDIGHIGKAIIVARRMQES